MNHPSIFFLLLLASLAYSCNSSKPTSNIPPDSSPNSEIFEGVIVYDFKIKDKTGEMTDQDLQNFMGDKQVYTIKGGKYKSEMNGMLKMTQYYVGTDTIFMHMQGQNSLMWLDATVEDPVISSEINENQKEILGLMCHQLTVKSADETVEYFYHPTYKLPKQAFSKHAYGYWNHCIEKTGALPLMNSIDDKELFIEITAQEIIPQKISDEVLTLPNLPRLKSSEE